MRQFDIGLIRTRTCGAESTVEAAGKLRCSKPKLTPGEETHLVHLQGTGACTMSEITERFAVALN